MTSWNLADLLESVVDVAPDREAVVCAGRRLTYAQLDAATNRVAHLFARLGVGPGDRVGLALHNRAEHIEAMFGAFKLRAVPVNVNLRYTADELRAILDDARPALLVHEEAVSEAVAAALEGARCAPRAVQLAELVELAAREPDSRPDVERSGDDRYLLYTGGTTGKPKGVLWRHEDLVFGALGGDDVDDDPATESSSRLLPVCPLTHGTAQWMSFLTLRAGNTLVLDPSPNLDPARVWDLVDAEEVSRLGIVGDAVARPLVDALDAEPDRWHLDSLVIVASGGAALSAPTRDALLAHLPGVAVVDGYGASETGGHGRMVVFAGQSPMDGPGLMRFVADDTTAVLDEDLRPIPPGSDRIGRVARRGAIPLGYLGDPQRTAATFPEVDGVRWAMTGDLAMVDAEGRIVVLGRDAATINTGGEKVFAEEVEVVLKTHADVADAIVVGVPDERWGTRVGAVVALRGGATASAAELQAHCRATLAGFKVPRQVLLTDHVRRTAGGKAELLWARQLLEGSGDEG